MNRKSTKISRNLPKIFQKLPKSVYQEFELKSFFHCFLTIFDLSEDFLEQSLKLSEYFKNVFTKCFHR